MSDTDFDVAIIGSGPAGLWAAEELINNNPKLKVAIFEKNPFSSGGLINDCKLILSTQVGMDLQELNISEDEAWKHIRTIDDKFLSYGADTYVHGTDDKEVEKLAKIAKWCGAQLIPSKQRHIGTDKAGQIVKQYKQDLEAKAIKFFTNTNISDIRKHDDLFKLYSNGSDYNAKFVICAPGRDGAYWLRDLAKKLKIEYRWSPVDIGVRLEVLKEVFDSVTDVIYDPKFVFYTKCHNDKVRTFCTNPGGRVVVEKPNEYGFRLINGDALKDKKTLNTNFALLNTMNLTQPYADTTEMARSIALETNRLGGGKPIMQRMGDFLEGNRSKLETFFDNSKDKEYDTIIPTLKPGSQAIPGDLCYAYRARTVDNLREVFTTLNNIVPGVAHPATVIYAPEIKFYDTKYQTTKELETNLPGFYVAGDGAGKSRGIVGAAMTGIIAARGILDKL
ncbi:FAD-dependent oxidoreductase [Candidatus Woesearchaeota archaeon]|nr:FAD-dependent oxidoreductase [Candidatus Woesearchaeota archaeon]